MQARHPLRISALLAFGLLLAVHLGFGLLPSVPLLIQARITDELFRLRSGLASAAPPYDGTVVHVAIDDSSFEALGTPYLGRAEYARLVRNLGRAEVAAQLHDAIFVAPQDVEEDAALIEATREAGSVYYGVALGLAKSDTSNVPSPGTSDADQALEGQRWRPGTDAPGYLISTRRTVTFPALTAAARGLGFLDITADPDGVYRRAPLLARDGGAVFPSMPLRIACDFLGVAPEQIEIERGAVVLRGARSPGEDTTREIRIPVDDQGRMIVNYLGPWGSMTHYPFFAVYEASDDRFMMQDLRDELRGKIAVVSWVKTGAGDVGPVPVDPLYPLSGIHASVINTILTGEFLREMSPVAMLFAVELPLLFLVVVLAARFRAIPFVGLVVGLTLFYVLIAIATFLKFDLILDIPGPIALLVGGTIVMAAHQLHLESRARAVLRHTFEAFFPPSIVRKVTARPDALLHDAHKKELTILFSDIKSFTRLTASMDPAHVRKLLNEYFERMSEIVFRHEGTLDKFIGDGLMVFFGDPEPQPDHATRAVRTAVEMQRAVRELAAEWKRRGDMPLEIRVGINSGEVVVGNMGSSRRVSYTVLGEPVNLAQRLESVAPTGGVLISARTRELAGGTIDARPQEAVRVKGFDRPIEVFSVEIRFENP